MRTPDTGWATLGFHRQLGAIMTGRAVRLSMAPGLEHMKELQSEMNTAQGRFRLEAGSKLRLAKACSVQLGGRTVYLAVLTWSVSEERAEPPGGLPNEYWLHAGTGKNFGLKLYGYN